MTTSTYGYCPFCKQPGKSRERRPNGEDTCVNGHNYPSTWGLEHKPADPHIIRKSKVTTTAYKDGTIVQDVDIHGCITKQMLRTQDRQIEESLHKLKWMKLPDGWTIERGAYGDIVINTPRERGVMGHDIIPERPYTIGGRLLYELLSQLPEEQS